MGNGHSSAKAAEEEKPETGTTLFGAWDKPVADAYALKKQVSKKGRKSVSKAADAAGAAVGSTFQMEAGAGVKPSGAKAASAQKGAGTACLQMHSMVLSEIVICERGLESSLTCRLIRVRQACVNKSAACAGAFKGVRAKKGGEAWTLSQSRKDPAKVTAAKQALKGKLCKPMPKKTTQARHPH